MSLQNQSVWYYIYYFCTSEHYIVIKSFPFILFTGMHTSHIYQACVCVLVYIDLYRDFASKTTMLLHCPLREIIKLRVCRVPTVQIYIYIYNIYTDRLCLCSSALNVNFGAAHPVVHCRWSVSSMMMMILMIIIIIVMLLLMERRRKKMACWKLSRQRST